MIKNIKICSKVLILIFLSLLIYLVLQPVLDHSGASVLALAFLMFSCWIGNLLSTYFIFTIPLVGLGILGLLNLTTIWSAYLNPILGLFLGGFILSLSIEETRLHKRFALIALSTASSYSGLLFSFIVCSGFLSMWLSNTATTLVMLPIGIAIIQSLDKFTDDLIDKDSLATPMLLAIAFGANFGGSATLIGTPPNIILASFLQENHNQELTFLDWLQISFPISVILLFLLWICLKFHSPKNVNIAAASVFLKEQKRLLPSFSRSELVCLVIFIGTIFLWILRPFLKDLAGLPISDTQIALFSGLLCLILPTSKKWSPILPVGKLKKVPWDILLLFGSGILIAKSLEVHGVLAKFGLMIQTLPKLDYFETLSIIVASSIFISELINNMSQVMFSAPLVSEVCTVFGFKQIALLAPMTLAASSASMLPTGTAPNMIVYATGRIRIGKMILIGFTLNLLAILVIVSFFIFYQKLNLI